MSGAGRHTEDKPGAALAKGKRYGASGFEAEHDRGISRERIFQIGYFQINIAEGLDWGGLPVLFRRRVSVPFHLAHRERELTGFSASRNGGASGNAGHPPLRVNPGLVRAGKERGDGSVFEIDIHFSKLRWYGESRLLCRFRRRSGWRLKQQRGLEKTDSGDARFSVEQGPEIRIDGPFVHEQRHCRGTDGQAGNAGRRTRKEGERSLIRRQGKPGFRSGKAGGQRAGEPNGILIERIDEEAERKDERPEKGEQNIKEDGGGTLHVCSCL